MLLYVAGPYGPKTRHVADVDAHVINPLHEGAIDDNIQHARTVAIRLWEDGHAVICPHLNTAHMERDCKATHADYMRGDLMIVSRCDGVVMLDGWKDSKGAIMEHAHAKDNGIPVWYEGLTWPEAMNGKANSRGRQPRCI